jgi:hypothetical protein
VCAAIAWSRAVAAEPASSFIDVVPPVGDHAPQLRATIIGAPRGDAAAVRVLDEGAGEPIVAATLTGVPDGGEPTALAIVFEGWEGYVGTTGGEYEEWQPQVPGPLVNVNEALDRFDFTKLGPNSEAVVVTYANGAVVRMPLGAIARLHGKPLGAEKDYAREIGTDLVQGIALGLDQLRHSHATRKAMLVIGDGNDTNNEAARVKLSEWRARAAAERVELFAIIWKSALSSEANVISVLVPDARTVNSADGTAAEIARMMSRLGDRYYATFPGEGLRWDGQRHRLAIEVAGQRLPSVEVVLAPVWERPAERSHVWWIAIAAVVCAAAAAFIAWRRKSRANSGWSKG